MSIIGGLDVVQGEDLLFNVAMTPSQPVAGWTVALYGSSAKVNVVFPPATSPSPGIFLWPTTPSWAIVTPTRGVVPGIQPALPTTGTTLDFYRDNTDDVAGGGISTLDSGVGVFQISLPRELTLNLLPGTYFFQFWRIDPGLFRKYAEGSILVTSGN